MKLDLHAIQPFNPRAGHGNLSATWKLWIKRFQTYLKAADVTEPEQRRALSLYFAGEEVQKIFDTLPDTGDDDNFELAVEKLTSHFAPSHNVDLKYFSFVKLINEQTNLSMNFILAFESSPKHVSLPIQTRKSKDK